MRRLLERLFHRELIADLRATIGTQNDLADEQEETIDRLLFEIDTLTREVDDYLASAPAKEPCEWCGGTGTYQGNMGNCFVSMPCTCRIGKKK